MSKRASSETPERILLGYAVDLLVAMQISRAVMSVGSLLVSPRALKVVDRSAKEHGRASREFSEACETYRRNGGDVDIGWFTTEMEDKAAQHDDAVREDVQAFIGRYSGEVQVTESEQGNVAKLEGEMRQQLRKLIRRLQGK